MPGRTTPRVPIGTLQIAGRRPLTIYQDGNRLSITITVRGEQDELRFDLNTAHPELRRAVERRIRELDETVPDTPIRGTIGAAIVARLRSLGLEFDGPRWTPRKGLPAERAAFAKEEAGRLKAWYVIGDESFVRIPLDRLKDLTQGWLDAGVSHSTVARRITSLRSACRAQVPEDHPSLPIERLKRPRTPRTGIVRARPLPLVRRVLDNVEAFNQSANRPSYTRPILEALFWTGLPGSLLKKVERKHVRFGGALPELFVQPRRKGAGVDAGWIAILPEAGAALRAYFARGCDKADAPGWNRGVLRRAFNAGIRRTQTELRTDGREDLAELLDGMRPYDLRHSIGTALLEASGDINAVAEYLRHSDIRTTKQYTTGAAGPSIRSAIGALHQALAEPAPAAAERSKRPRSKRPDPSSGSKFNTEKEGRKAKKSETAGKIRRTPISFVSVDLTPRSVGPSENAVIAPTL